MPGVSMPVFPCPRFNARASFCKFQLSHLNARYKYSRGYNTQDRLPDQLDEIGQRQEQKLIIIAQINNRIAQKYQSRRQRNGCR